jgi:hypothetical protein
MTEIVQVYQGKVTPAFVDSWFRHKTGRDAPVGAWLFKQKADEVGVHWVGLYCMALVETGYFVSKIFRDKRNLFGLGAVDKSAYESAVSFVTYNEAVTAGAQHLAVYAGVDGIDKKPQDWFILERSFKLGQWGFYGLIGEFWELGGKSADGKILWASNPQHGTVVENLIGEIERWAAAQLPVEPTPVTTPKPEPVPVPAPTKGDGWVTVVSGALRVAGGVVVKFVPWIGWVLLGASELVKLFAK